MTTDRLVQLQTGLIATAVGILSCGVPWAYVMHGVSLEKAA